MPAKKNEPSYNVKKKDKLMIIEESDYYREGDSIGVVTHIFSGSVIINTGKRITRPSFQDVRLLNGDKIQRKK